MGWRPWVDPPPKKKKDPWADHPSAKRHAKSKRNEESERGEKVSTHIFYAVVDGKRIKYLVRGTAADLQQQIRTVRDSYDGNVTIIIHH